MVSAKTPDINSLAGINTLNSTPDAKSSSGFIQQINRLSEQEAIAQGYTVIKTAQDLDNIRNDLDGKYILMNDIDLSSYSNWDPIGDYDSGASFTGLLDGNGYTISNLTINRPDEDGVGLFVLIGVHTDSYVGRVQNLGFENANITGAKSVGPLAGFSAGTITNCYATGSITGNNQTGGLIGAMGNGLVSDCYAKSDVDGYEKTGGLTGIVNMGTVTNSFSTGDVNGYNYTGGLVGRNLSGTISNSYAKGDVAGDQNTGGLMGCSSSGSILNCYATGGVQGNLNTGGLAGEINGGSSTISNSYALGLVQGVTNVGGLLGQNSWSTIKNSIWNTETTGQSVANGYSDHGVETNNQGLTTTEIKDLANWQGWDDTVWDFSEYPPKLKWQDDLKTPIDAPPDPSHPGDEPIPGAVRLQIGSDSSSTSAIYVDTSFDLGAFDVDFSSADSCAAAIEDIDEVLSRINTKRSEFGAVINRLSSILESQTTTIQNFTSAQSTIMDADIANESADFVKNQILQQTSSAFLAQSQNLHASIVLSLIG